MSEIAYSVPDISCSHCERAVSDELLAVAGSRPSTSISTRSW